MSRKSTRKPVPNKKYGGNENARSPHVIQNKLDVKQITFDVDENSILIWRRLLLVRYFQIMASFDQFDVHWSDFDKLMNTLELDDEERPFVKDNKPEDLFKSVTQIYKGHKKLLTITLYYSTYTCLVQGNITQDWIKKEFDTIKSEVESINEKLKSNPEKCDVDSEIKNIPLPLVNSEKQTLVINEKQNDPLHLVNDNRPNIDDDSENDKNDEAEPMLNDSLTLVKKLMNEDDQSGDELEINDSANTLCYPINVSNNEVNTNTNTEHNTVSPNTEVKSIKEALHTVENELIESVIYLKEELTSLRKEVKEIQSIVRKIDNKSQEWKPPLGRIETGVKSLETSLSKNTNKLLNKIEDETQVLLQEIRTNEITIPPNQSENFNGDNPSFNYDIQNKSTPKVGTSKSTNTYELQSGEENMYEPQSGEEIYFKGHENPMSNFYPCEIRWNNQYFKSSEHIFNFEKAQFYGLNRLAYKIKHSQHAGVAKSLGKNVRVTPEWENVKEDIMYNILRAKAEYCPEFAQNLSSSGDKTLIEDVPDDYWGRGHDNRGQNKLGMLLEEIRSEFNSTKKKSLKVPNVLSAENIAVHHNSDHHIVEESARSNSGAWLICTSIVSRIVRKKFYKKNRITITTLRDKTIQGATEFISSGKVQAEAVIYQVGSNDLEESNANAVFEKYKQLIETTRYRLGEKTEILASEILPRFYRNYSETRRFNFERERFNEYLYDYCQENNVKFVSQINFNQSDFTDGIHPNVVGIGKLVKNYKIVLNPLLGVKSNYEFNEGDSSFFPHNRFNQNLDPSADRIVNSGPVSRFRSTNRYGSFVPSNKWDNFSSSKNHSNDQKVIESVVKQVMQNMYRN